MILAGVGLSFVLGDNGILKKAQESADAYKNKAGEESNTLDMVNGYLENMLGNTTTGGGEEQSSTSYVGYYADTDGDGAADGIIYADLAVGGSETTRIWGNYKYEKVTDGLKSYTVSSTGYTGLNGEWTQPVVSVKKESTGSDRFYVMALEDINQGTYYSWYYNAGGKLDNTVDCDANDFGQGRSNTETMVEEWNSAKYGAPHKNDLWGIVQGKTVDDNGNITTDETKNYVSKGWFVPSKGELSAFTDMILKKIGVMYDKYKVYGFGGMYWTSAISITQNGYSYAYEYSFPDGRIGQYDVRFGTDCCNVRLSTTF